MHGLAAGLGSQWRCMVKQHHNLHCERAVTYPTMDHAQVANTRWSSKANVRGMKNHPTIRVSSQQFVTKEMQGREEHADHPQHVQGKKKQQVFITNRVGGKNTLVIHNTCEDSLLAAPIILDLVLLAELTQRIELRRDGQPFQVLACWLMPTAGFCNSMPTHACSAATSMAHACISIDRVVGAPGNHALCSRPAGHTFRGGAAELRNI
eukprot:1160892-Pelagomonas_calceolata.AAC.3